MTQWSVPKEWCRLNWQPGYPTCSRCKRNERQTLQLAADAKPYCLDCVRDALEALEAAP